MVCVCEQVLRLHRRHVSALQVRHLHQRMSRLAGSLVGHQILLSGADQRPGKGLSSLTLPELATPAIPLCVIAWWESLGLDTLSWETGVQDSERSSPQLQGHQTQGQ